MTEEQKKNKSKKSPFVIAVAVISFVLILIASFAYVLFISSRKGGRENVVLSADADVKYGVMTSYEL